MSFKQVKFSYYFMRSLDKFSAKYKHGVVEATLNRRLITVPKDCDRAVRACLKV